jgi:RND family efflux transporter MFP subunit
MTAGSERPFSPAVYGVLIVTATLAGVAGTGLALRSRPQTASTVRSSAPGGPPPTRDTPGRAPIVLDSRRQQLIGVRTAHVTRDSLTNTVRAVGIVREDERRVADFNLKLDGWIKDLYVSSIGERVKIGQPLFTAYSQDLDALQGNFIATLNARDQTRNTQSTDGPALNDRLVTAARQRLKQWDLAEDELRDLEATRRIPPAVIFRSPMDGVVVAKSAIRGMHVQAGQQLYRLANLSIVLIEASFRETDARFLTEATPAEITVDALPGQRLHGRILGTDPYVSEQTRTVRARLQVSNLRGQLKPGMFATVELKVALQKGLVIPADAIIDSGSRQIVFVAQGAGRFEPREVTVGAKDDKRAMILSGLRETEEVVTRAAFFLDSESQMHAGIQAYDSVPSSPGVPADGQDLAFTIEITPDPPHAGENVVQVRVVDANAAPVTDLELRLNLSMPPMPAMNMPAMRSGARLTHLHDGLYRGAALVSMAGRWDLLLTAMRQGRSVASQHSTLLVR